MKILALIIARGASKRLPRKNIRPLGGKPLIAWSVDVVKNIAEICDILVSTDDLDIARICKDAGAYVPWIRPEELATDTASSVDVALHALDWYESNKNVVDGILLLQPTSPFRTKETIQRGIELFGLNQGKPIVGVSRTHAHPMWTLKMEGDFLVPFIDDKGFRMRSQDLPMAYVINGSFYLTCPNKLRSDRSFIGKETIPLIIESPKEALDIDTEWDFNIAEIISGYQ